ncbi:Negative regulator of sexual conjugation and meiosis [Hypsizygus marmoreus]|uniref:Negative regulator of sexual conjugation and meiosis n=1 Tax=Hypsizygus marmoreus TaxID=39966 RepID=A0A369KAV2_HYPMA|nr:Negative regulator of sexual conjugation and meiosis [Hypsizygus marmoreus]
MPSDSPALQLQLGTCIDGGSLQLVEVLGVGGYGVVYRAVETCTSKPQSFAVKCLLHAQAQSSIRRQLHIREIALHQISSAHPGVITLHRVIEDDNYTYIVMDYAPDHDLFTQILNNCRYIGNDALIKHVFLQLLDAVEYCHSLGIYHRDLKPENVLCFDEGLRVAITDFGLATTEKISGELRTGSIYHMSPECQGGGFAPNGSYSPMSNDVWSLGIILLNLATGRNPWRTATQDDLTFQAYLRNPLSFFPSVLPVSTEVNALLIQMLHVDWTQRMTLAEVREEMEDIERFYASDTVFEGSQARCAWEVGTGIQCVSSIHEEERYDEPVQGLKSHWSADSRSEMAFQPQAADRPQDPHWSFDEGDVDFARVGSHHAMTLDTHTTGGSSSSSYCSYSTSPSTPDSANGSFQGGHPATNLVIFDKPLRQTEKMMSTCSGSSVMVMSKPKDVVYPSSCFFDSPQTSDDPMSGHGRDGRYSEEIDLSNTWAFAAGNYAPSMESSDSDTNSGVSCEIAFTRSRTPSLDGYGWECSPVTNPTGTSVYSSPEFHESKGFNPIKFFSRPTQFLSTTPKGSFSHEPHPTAPKTSPINIPASAHGHNCFEGNSSRIDARVEADSRCRKLPYFGSTKWFSPGKLFTST